MTENGGALSTLVLVTQDNSIESSQSAASTTLQWYAIQTRSRHEKRVEQGLREKAVHAFLPLNNTQNQWSDRQKTVELPLFPGYVFVNIAPDAQSRVPVLQTYGVISFLGVRGIGTPIPESEISAVQMLLQEKIPFVPYPFLRVGQGVRIRGGSLDGIKGILTQIRGDQSLVVSVELIQRSIAMRLSGFQVEAI